MLKNVFESRHILALLPGPFSQSHACRHTSMRKRFNTPLGEVGNPDYALLSMCLLAVLRAAPEHCTWLQAAKGLPAEDGSSPSSSARPDGSSAEEGGGCLRPVVSALLTHINHTVVAGHSMHPAAIQEHGLQARAISHSLGVLLQLAGP